MESRIEFATELTIPDIFACMPRPDDTRRIRTGEHGSSNVTAGSSTRHLALLMSANWLRTILLMVVGFILVPLQIREFGLIAFGLLVLIQQFNAALATPIRTSTFATIVKSLTEARSDEGEQSAIAVFTNAVTLLAALTLGLLAISTLTAAAASSILSIPDDLTGAMQLAIVTEGVVVGSALLTDPWHAVMLHERRVFAYNLDLTIRRWLDIAAFGVALLPLGWDSLVAFLIARTILVIAQSGLRVVIGTRISVVARVRPTTICRERIHRLWSVGVLTASQPFCNFNLFVLDNYLLNVIFGPAVNGIYAIVTLLRGYARRLGSEVYQGTEALAADLTQRSDHEANTRLMLTVVRVTSGVMLFSTMIVVVYFESLIELWLGSRIEVDRDLAAVLPFDQTVRLIWLMLVVLVAGGVLLEIGTAASKFLFGMGLVRRYAGILFGAGAAKAMLSLGCLALLMSSDTAEPPPSWAIVFPITTMVVQFIAFGLVLPARIVQLTSVSWRDLGIAAMVRPITMVLPATLLSLLLTSLLRHPNWVTLGVELLATVAVGILMAMLVLLEPAERTRVLSRIRSRLPMRSPSPGE